MLIPFHPAAGQVALIEPEVRFGSSPGSDGFSQATAMVDNESTDVLTLCELSSPDLAEGTEVAVSIFAPETLYRIHAASHRVPSDRLAVDPIHDVERIKRGSWPRHALHLDVTLAAVDGPGEFTGVAGRTLELGMAGLRVETMRRLPPGTDVTVMLSLPDGARLIARTPVVSVYIGDGGCEYRLAFHRLDCLDAAHLLALVGRSTALTQSA